MSKVIHHLIFIIKQKINIIVQKNMSNSLELSHELYRWLVTMDVLPNNLKYKASGNFEVESRLAEQLQSGFLVARLVTQLGIKQSVNMNLPLLSSIKNSNTPAARVYNWNILHDSFQKLDIHLSKQAQKEITSGDFQSLQKFLIEINLKEKQKGVKTEKNNESSQSTFDLRKIKKYENVRDSESVLEIVLILLSHSFSLTPKQALATLAQSAKYLSHLIVKGMKGSFDEVINFLEDAQANLSQLIYLTEKDSPSKNLSILLEVFKPTFISRDSQVARLGANLLKKINYESLKYNGKNIIYQLLCQQPEGFNFIYMGLKRHTYLNQEIFEFLYPLVEHSFTDFFNVQFVRTINNQQQYLLTLITLLEPIFEDAQAKENLWKSGLIELWRKKVQSTLSSKIKGKDQVNITQETKILYTELMYHVLLNYYDEFERSDFEAQLIQLAEQIKKNTRSEVISIKVPALYKLFNLLEFMAQKKNKLAALLYKKLIFLFVENHESTPIREIIVSNFVIILKKFPTIPLEFLTQPLLRQLLSTEGKSYILNMYDFQLMVQICRHPKMNEEQALMFLEYLLNLYTKSIIYSPIIFKIIEQILDRFCESQAIRQSCLSSTLSNLSMYSMLVLGKSHEGTHNRKKYQSVSKQQKIINNQKKSLIIELIKKFIKLQHRDLTSKIKIEILELYFDWYENKGIQDRGLQALLMEIGDIDELLMEFASNKQQEKQKQQTDNAESINEPYGDNRSSQYTSPIMNYKVDSTTNNEGYIFDKKMKDLGLGYKKNNSIVSKKQLIMLSKSNQPDPRVMEDIEKVKQKWKLDYSRSKALEQQQKQEKTYKINKKQLLQRNLSLGYAKIPNYDPQKILFQYDTVRKNALKDSLEPIDLQLEEDREKSSVENILQRYQKYIKIIFNKYSKKSGYSSNNKNDTQILSFTEIMKMLKQKDLLGKTPKIMINEIITSINQKKRKDQNILGGIYFEDFPTFLVYLTDTYLKYNYEHASRNIADQPFGIKVEKTILRMLENEPILNCRQLFDPKIQKIKQELEYDQNIQIPEGFKKINEVQIELNRSMKHPEVSNIKQKYFSCYELLDGIIYEALGIHIVTPFTDFIEKPTIVPHVKIRKHKPYNQSTQKNLKNDNRLATESENMKSGAEDLHANQFDVAMPSKKSSLKKSLNKSQIRSQSHRNVVSNGNFDGLDEQAQKKWVQKERKRQQHAKKLRNQLQKLKEEKQKKDNEEKQKQKLKQEKERKKNQLRKQYLEENKKKLQEMKHKQEQEEKEKQQKEKHQKEKRKVELKEKGAELLEKQRKLIQNKLQKVQQKKKNEEFIKNKRQAKLMGKITDPKQTQSLVEEQKKEAQKQKMKDLLITNSLENGDLKQISTKYSKQLNQLFQAYWIWNKQKIDLKNFAEILKDFEISQQYVSPKVISETFKAVAKGSLVGLNGFIQCIAKLSYKSEEIEEKVKGTKKEEQQEKSGEKINSQNFRFMVKQLLKMDDKNYKQLLAKTKGQ